MGQNKIKKSIFSGIQPTGALHIGNYLGAIRQWVELQKKYEKNIFCIVDLHAITIPQNPKELKQRIRETASLLIASGIDPKKSIIFVQSHISAHSELTWILNCLIPIGWMNKMTQFKEKAKGQKSKATVGLFDYPALMAADILLYQTDLVPVGEDQKQHVELARDIAKRFNYLYGRTFKIPQALISPEGKRIKGLKNPKRKMSKSESGENNLIYLLDPAEKIYSKIMGAVTDSKKEIAFDKKRPGIYNLLTIYKLFINKEKNEIENHFRGKNYSEFKKELAELIIEKLKPIQKKYKEISSDKDYIEKIFKEHSEKIRPVAEKTLAEVKKKMGLG